LLSSDTVELFDLLFKLEKAFSCCCLAFNNKQKCLKLCVSQSVKKQQYMLQINKRALDAVKSG